MVGAVKIGTILVENQPNLIAFKQIMKLLLFFSYDSVLSLVRFCVLLNVVSTKSRSWFYNCQLFIIPTIIKLRFVKS